MSGASSGEFDNGVEEGVEGDFGFEMVDWMDLEVIRSLYEM